MTHYLFPVKVGGHGTAEIESLPSYIHRLAYQHGIYVGELLRFVARQVESDNEYPFPLQKLPSYTNPHDILRKNRLSDSIIHMLEYSTRQNLSGSTVSIFSDTLTISRNELYKGFRWCPECLSEIINTGEQPYFKVIWQFRAVVTCPIHRTPLVQTCEHCGYDQTGYKKNYPLAFCQSCGQPLYKRKNRLSVKDIANSWQDIGRDIVELLNDLSENGYDSVSRSKLLKSINDLFDEFWSQGREDEFYQLLNRDLLLSVMHHGKSLCLNDVRKISFGLGISLYDLMSGNAAKQTSVIFKSNYCPFPPSFLETSIKIKRDHRVIQRRFLRQLEGKSKPKSLNQISEELGVSTGYLRYRYPLQVRMIAEKYKQYEKERLLRIEYKAQNAALKYFTEGSENAPKSRKQAYFKLREETGIAKFVLKRAINSVYESLL